MTALRSSIDEAAQLDRIDVPRNGRSFGREITKHLPRCPRYIEGSLMQRLEMHEALSRIDLTTGTVVTLLPMTRAGSSRGSS